MPRMISKKKIEEKDKTLLMAFIVHASDISNPIQKFENFKSWGIRIAQEFNDLYEAELDLQKIYGDEKSGGAQGIAAPLPFLKYDQKGNDELNFKVFAKG